MHAVVGAGVEPGVAPAHDFDFQLLALQINAVEVGDLQLAARRGLQIARQVAHLGVVKVQTGDRIVRLGAGGLFFDAQGAALRIKGHHAIAFGVLHMVGKHRGTVGAGMGRLQLLDQVMAVKNIVAQHQGAGVVTDKVAADHKGLGQAIGAGLHRVLDVHAPSASVTEQLGKARRVLRGGDDQDLADATEHQGAERVIDHGLVVNGQQLLGDHGGGRVQAGAGATGEQNAFAVGHARLLGFMVGGEWAGCRSLHRHLLANRAISRQSGFASAGC